MTTKSTRGAVVLTVVTLLLAFPAAAYADTTPSGGSGETSTSTTATGDESNTEVTTTGTIEASPNLSDTETPTTMSEEVPLGTETQPDVKVGSLNLGENRETEKTVPLAAVLAVAAVLAGGAAVIVRRRR